MTGTLTLEGYQGKGVNVFFYSTKVSVSCFLDEVSHLHACAPHTRDAVPTRPVRSRDSLCAAAPQPSLHE